MLRRGTVVQCNSAKLQTLTLQSINVRMVQRRIFAGANIRNLRKARGLRQSELASLLGISPSYLSQVESDDRALTPTLNDSLRRHFPVEWQDIPTDQAAELLHAFEEALNSSVSPVGHTTAQVRKIVEQFPEFAERFIHLNRDHRTAIQRLEMLDEAIGANNAAGGRLPWEEVRDWFHNTNNYVDTLDRAAEAFSETISDAHDSPSTTQMVQWLERQGTSLRFSGNGPVRRYDNLTDTLTINTAKTNESARFHISWHIASTAFNAEIADISQNAILKSETARHLLTIGLGNYAAGSILMPYGRFRSAARSARHDIDRLRHTFGSTFEQVCHRLSTLQRPGARGTPMYFCRVDMAGNITKRHSATRLRFARFGGACPLWVVHEAVAVPDRIHVQLSEMPDGVRYVSIAKGIVKQTDSFLQQPRRYAVALGCEVDFAPDFIYADGINLQNPDTPTHIGESCRICTRDDCDQRAFPPSDKEITVNPQERDIVPYKIQSRAFKP
ncbi:helix-turn-helix domain-containing protein [Novosphingobium silvae]